MEIKSRPVWESLKFYLTSLKNLPVSESLMLDGDKGFCVSTGSSWDSWVYYPERLKDSDTVKEILKFFNSRRIAFLFPVYDADNGSEKICKDCGLFFRENFTAMSFVPKTSPETDPEMNEICRLSANKKIVLLSMEGGLIFYKNFGFEELSTIPIYSNEIKS